MMRRLSITVHSTLDRAQVTDTVRTGMTGRRWSSSERSEQGGWRVSTLDLPGSVVLWAFDDDPGRLYAEIFGLNDDLTGDDLDAWRRTFYRQIITDLIPLLGDAEPLEPALVTFLDGG
jgi:hypothetical protein